MRSAAREQLPFPFPNLNIVQNRRVCALAGDGPRPVLLFTGGPDSDPGGAVGDLSHQVIIDFIDYHKPRTCRTLLAREAERCRRNPFCSRFQIGRLIDHYGILAAHLGHHALDP